MNDKPSFEKINKKKKDKKKSESNFNITMNENIHSSIEKSMFVTTYNIETLLAKTQERFSRALERRYQFESNLKPAQEFLLEHVNSKISLIIMYADLVGSTNMSMMIPIDKMVTIIQGFSFEMSHLVHNYGGYVLKYVGDAIIAFFPLDYNKSLICNKAIECAQLMITIIKKGISPILYQYNYPELQVKIGIDVGESIIIQYGHDERSHIDILGYSMNKSAKITSLTYPNTITIGEDMYSNLNPKLKVEFKGIKTAIENWKYINKKTGQIYKIYSSK
jgi:adenylate cyclase